MKAVLAQPVVVGIAKTPAILWYPPQSYLSSLLKNENLSNEDKIAIGNEESAGLPIKSHYAKKVGVLAYLLATQAVATRGAWMTKPLSELQAHLEDRAFDGSSGIEPFTQNQNQ